MLTWKESNCIMIKKWFTSNITKRVSSPLSIALFTVSFAGSRDCNLVMLYHSYSTNCNCNLAPKNRSQSMSVCGLSFYRWDNFILRRQVTVKWEIIITVNPVKSLFRHDCGTKRSRSHVRWWWIEKEFEVVPKMHREHASSRVDAWSLTPCSSLKRVEVQ